MPSPSEQPALNQATLVAIARAVSSKEFSSLYEEVCEEPLRLQTALNPDAAWGKIWDRAYGKLWARFFYINSLAYGRRMSQTAVDKWAGEETYRLVSSYWRDMETSHDPVGATRRHLSAIDTWALPKHFRGKHKKPRTSLLPSEDALLREHDELVDRCRKVMRMTPRLPAMMKEFRDVSPELIDRPGRLYPERFAKDALAKKYDCSSRKIAGLLRRARRTQQTPPSP